MFFDRTGGKGSTRSVQTSTTKAFRAPYRGYVRSSVPGAPKEGEAVLLDNWFPTTEGARVRKGSLKKATIGAAVTHIRGYEVAGSQKLFAMDVDSIYDITSPADPDMAETAIVTSLTSGDWSSVQFVTSGGTFLVMVNGADDMEQYDGSAWYPVSTDGVYLLHYDAESADFTLGETVTGGTSGATGDIVGIYDAGTTGTLYINNVSGTFQNDETITDGATGSATSNIPSGIGSARTITGVNTSTFRHVWAHKERLFFIGDGMSAWYLPTKSIGGAATELPLGSIFPLGGTLLFGGTWSQDSGDGLDDYCVFVTTKGEVAVYQGTDPGSASTWSLVGVYRIGQPLHKNAHFRSGGDLAILTDEGIVPISEAVRKDRAALPQVAVTRPIEPVWRTYMQTRAGLSVPFSCVLWKSAAMLFIGMPYDTGQEIKALAANAITGAWSSGFTGWDAQCCTVYDDKLYFGTGSATIMQGDVGGSDDGTAYQAVALCAFDQMKTPVEKVALHARATVRTNYPFTFQMFVNSDYEIEKPTAVSADDIDGGSVWGSGIWDTMKWQAAGSEETKSVTSEWQTVNGTGYVLAPGMAITIGGDVAPDIELTDITLVAEFGEVMG